MAIQQRAMKNSDTDVADVETFETIVIGGGQAGLSVGYYLKRRGGSFVILDANERIGGSWRTRTWNSLRLFTPARYDGLPGWPFPAAGWSYPTARETADYLEAYAARFELPVRGVPRGRRDRLLRDPVRAWLRRRARPEDRADALERVPRSLPAPTGGRPAGWRRELGSGHRDRGVQDPSDLSFRSGQGAGADPDREPAGAVRVADPLVRRLARSDCQDSDRPQGPAARARERRAADPGEDG